MKTHCRTKNTTTKKVGKNLHQKNPVIYDGKTRSIKTKTQLHTQNTNKNNISSYSNNQAHTAHIIHRASKAIQTRQHTHE
jgi:hypothetical protein